MRIDYYYDVEIRQKTGQIIDDLKRLKALCGYEDKSPGANFTAHMDGALERMALKGHPLTLVWDEDTATLRARTSFHSYEQPTDEQIKLLTDYVLGQFSDGYGEAPMAFKKELSHFTANFQDNTLLGPKIIDDGVKIRAPSKSKQLLWAIEDGNFDKLMALIMAGANPKAKDRWGNTALQFAAQAGHADMVRLLLENKAEADIHALVNAAHSGCIETIALLADADIDVNMKYNAPDDFIPEISPLNTAASCDRLDAAKFLLEIGADPNTQCGRGQTPLMHAQSIEMLALLLSNGADASLRDNHGDDAPGYHEKQASFWDGDGYWADPDLAKKIREKVNFLKQQK